MEDNFIYQLSKTFQYSKEGNFAETASIEFTPPNMECLDESTDFEQLVIGAIVSAGRFANGNQEQPPQKDDKDSKEEEGMSPEVVEKLLYLSQDIKFKDVAKSFRVLAVKTATFDGTTKLINDHFGKFSKEDFISMLCGYAAFFVCPLLLKGE